MRQSPLVVLLCACLCGFGPLRAAVSDPVAGTPLTAARLPAVIADQGVDATAQELTQANRWSVVREVVLRGTPDAQAVLPGLLRVAPASRQPMLRAALRQRLLGDPLGTIALFDPARGAPFNGQIVCATPDRAWTRQAARAITSTHDVVHALQRIDCMRALGVANPD